MSVAQWIRAARAALADEGVPGAFRLARRRLGRKIAGTDANARGEMDLVLFDPASAPPLLPRRSADRLAIDWIAPPFGAGSGGHANIARMVRSLAGAGHSVRIFIQPEMNAASTPPTSRRYIEKHFGPIPAEIIERATEIPENDITVSTSWQSAYAALRAPRTRLRVHFLQDYSPLFYPAGSIASFAENSLRFGFPAVTLGPWLAELLARRFGIQTAAVDFGHDPGIYSPGDAREPGGTEPDAGRAHERGAASERGRPAREARTVAVYARWFTERRGFELAVAALAIAARRRPDLEIVVFGARRMPFSLPFRARLAGLLAPRALADLYRNASVGFVISFTNPSLVHLEMMACGLPVLDVQTDATRACYEGRGAGVALAPPTPQALAVELLALIEDAPRRNELSEAGIAYAGGRTWDRTGSQMEAALRRFYAAAPSG